MSKKKKILFKEKYDRRVMEAKKAENVFQPSGVVISSVGKYALPIERIKKDLVWNLIFVTVSIIFLIGLKYSGINLPSLVALFQRQ